MITSFLGHPSRPKTSDFGTLPQDQVFGLHNDKRMAIVSNKKSNTTIIKGLHVDIDLVLLAKLCIRLWTSQRNGLWIQFATAFLCISTCQIRRPWVCSGSASTCITAHSLELPNQQGAILVIVQFLHGIKLRFH